VLGENHTTFYKRAELKELIGIHGEGEGGKGGVGLLTKDEVMVIRGALEMRDKTIINLLTPINAVFMLDYNDRMDMTTIKKVLAHGHSRIPVFRDLRTNIVGVLHVKSLIELDPDDAIPVKDIQLLDCIWVDAATPVWDMLNMFQTGKGHLAIVRQSARGEVDVVVDDLPYGAEEEKGIPVGIVTLEDVFEELIQEEIQDETDVNKGDLQRQVRIAEMFRRVSAPIPYDTKQQGSYGNSYKSQSSYGSSQPHYSSSMPAQKAPKQKKPTPVLVQDDNYFGTTVEIPKSHASPVTPLLQDSDQATTRSVSWSLKE
jgi:CBS domain containing-hemolysin-like protein